MMVDTKLPGEITLHNGMTLTAVFLKIDSRDEKGRPEALTFLPADRVLELVGGEEFMLAYVDGRLLGTPTHASSEDS